MQKMFRCQLPLYYLIKKNLVKLYTMPLVLWVVDGLGYIASGMVLLGTLLMNIPNLRVER